MSKMTNQKKFVIATISAICIALVMILIVSNGGDRSRVKIANSENSNKEVTVGEIQSEVRAKPVTDYPSNLKNEEKITVPSINDDETKVESTNSTEIELTKITEKPQEPEKPVTAIDSVETHEKPTDPVLIDPTKKPSVKVEPVEPTKATEEKPSGGDSNNKGETYVPGFGWVKDSGANVGGTSTSEGDWNKQIGDMN